MRNACPSPRRVRPSAESLSPVCPDPGRAPSPHSFLRHLIPSLFDPAQKTRSFVFKHLHTLFNSQFRVSLLFCCGCALFGKNTPGWGFPETPIFDPSQRANEKAEDREASPPRSLRLVHYAWTTPRNCSVPRKLFARRALSLRWTPHPGARRQSPGKSRNLSTTRYRSAG